jgi:predicted permease
VGCVGIAVFAGLFAGAFPGWWNATRTVDSVLKAKGSGRVGATRLRNLFVVAQVALSLVLTIAGGLAVRTVTNLENVDLGVQATGRQTWSIDPVDNGYSGDDILKLISELERELVSHPQVASVGYIAPAPFAASGRISRFRPSTADEDAARTFYFFVVSPNFFATLDLSIRHGRDFRPNDPMRGIVVSSRAARELFPNLNPADAIGRSVSWNRGGQAASAVVIGVTDDVRLVDVKLSPYPVVFLAWKDQMPRSALTTYVAGTPGARPGAIGAAARSALTRLDPELPMYDVQTGEDLVATRFAEERVVARLASILATIGLFLCALGLFGVLSYAVTARKREFGIQIALGANAPHLIRKVIGGGLRLTLMGLAVGIPGAWALTRLASAHLYGVTAADPVTYAAGAATLILVSLAAGVLPVHRATCVSPVEVLREE